MLRKRGNSYVHKKTVTMKKVKFQTRKKRVGSSVHDEKSSSMKHELVSSVRVSEEFNLDDFVSIFIDDNDYVFPEFEINETPNEPLALEQ